MGKEVFIGLLKVGKEREKTFDQMKFTNNEEGSKISRKDRRITYTSYLMKDTDLIAFL